MSRFLLTLSLAAALAGPTFAQAPAEADRANTPVHRLEVRGGVVYHDGVALPPSAVPSNVDMRGFPPISMDYSGDVTPAIEIDGRVFAFADGKLIEVQNVQADEGAAQAYALSQPQTLARASGTSAPVADAEEAYMESLSERDRALYEQIVRERDMENEALRLAQQYHRTEREGERAALRAQLREKLASMFDLKQENRREEVRQMEEALNALRSRISERVEMRDKIVEHRLNELIGQ